MHENSLSPNFLLSNIAALVRSKFGLQSKNTRKLVVASSTRLTCLDPYHGYDWLAYLTLSGVSAGLTGLDEDHEIVPDLAKEIEYLNDGASLIFHLDPKRKFHNGQSVRAQDVVYSLHRMMSPACGSPGAGLFFSIIGSEDYNRGKADKIEGVKALSDLAVRIDLKCPSFSFAHVLSTNFGCVMPAGHDPKGFDLPISGGPMKIESFDEEGVLRTSKFEITPNKYKFAVAGMTLRTGIPKDEIQALYETGEISLLTDGMKWDSTSKNTAPSYEPPQEQSISAGLTYLALNTKLPPFDDVNIRRAVNYAINRTKLTELLGHAARPTSQILPPLFPERDDTISVDVYDPGKAASLLTGVDTPLEVDLYAVDDPMFRTMVDSIVQDLKAVGILVSPKYGSHQQIQSIGTDPDRGQMVFSDGLGWIPDYFHCSNFYFPLLSPTAIGGSGWNWSVYENLKVEQLVWHAESLLRDTQGEGRKSLWRHIFSLILDDAPIIPLYNRFQAATWVNSPSGEDTIPATSIGYLKTTSA